MSSKQNTVKDAVCAVAAAHFRDLLAENYSRAADDAIDAFRDDEESGTPSARISFSVTWNPMAAVPQVESKLSWSARRTFTTSDAADPNQLKFPAEVIDADGDGKGAA